MCLDLLAHLGELSLSQSQTIFQPKKGFVRTLHCVRIWLYKYFISLVPRLSFSFSGGRGKREPGLSAHARKSPYIFRIIHRLILIITVIFEHAQTVDTTLSFFPRPPGKKEGTRLVLYKFTKCCLTILQNGSNIFICDFLGYCKC